MAKRLVLFTGTGNDYVIRPPSQKRHRDYWDIETLWNVLKDLESLPAGVRGLWVFEGDVRDTEWKGEQWIGSWRRALPEDLVTIGLVPGPSEVWQEIAKTELEKIEKFTKAADEAAKKYSKIVNKAHRRRVAASKRGRKTKKTKRGKRRVKGSFTRLKAD